MSRTIRRQEGVRGGYVDAVRRSDVRSWPQPDVRTSYTGKTVVCLTTRMMRVER